MNIADSASLRLANRIRSKLDETFLSEYVLAMPSTVYIGLSTVCDIRCPYCPRQFYGADVNPGIMEFRDFQKVAPYLQYGEEAIFFGLGEPFLNPMFFDFLREIKRTGIKVSTSTHGMSLDPENRKKLLEAGLDELAVSIDGADKKTFERLRAGARFDVVVNNVTSLQEEKRKLGIDAPAIHVATAVSSHNVHQMEGVVKIARKLGAARVLFTDLILVNPENASISVSKTDVFRKHFHRAETLGKKYGLEVLYFYQYPFPWKKVTSGIFAHSSGKKHYACRDPWRVCIINRHGDMKPCCYYPPDTGNVFTNPLPDVINNEANRELRRRLIQGDPPECCLNCGMLKEITAGERLQAIDEAKSLLERIRLEGALASEEVNSLETLISEYRNKWEMEYSHED